MKFRCRLTALLFSALAFSVLASIAQAALPFSATFKIDETLDTSADSRCSILTGVILGQSQATRLGRTAISGTNCVTLPTNPAYPVFNFSQGKIVLLAANGDTMNGTFSGSFVPTDKANVFAVVNGTNSFNRGTGRFAAATGSGTLTDTQDIGTGKGQLQAKGTISY